MNIWEFYDKNQLLIVLSLILIWLIARFMFRIIILALRSSNIKSKGWPPSHLDADGDFKSGDVNAPEFLPHDIIP